MLVYVVEDDESIRQALIQVLQTIAAFELAGWSDSEQGAKAFLGHHSSWQCLILDLHLVEGSGFGVLRHVAGRPQDHHVVVLSNAGSKEHRDLCARLGANAFFDKTLEFDQFVRHIESLA